MPADGQIAAAVQPFVVGACRAAAHVRGQPNLAVGLWRHTQQQRSRMSASPPAAPSHASHLLATAAEFVLWSVLLWHQAVETTPTLRVRWDIWCRRIGCSSLASRECCAFAIVGYKHGRAGRCRI